MSREQNNLRAESFADQIQAAIREGDELPNGPLCAAAARTLPTDNIQHEGFRQAVKAILEFWAEMHDVDRPDAEK
jgi:hypothetical protein